MLFSLETIAGRKNMIILENVTKCFTINAVLAVDSVNLALPDEAILVISGHSGSGKTTLLRLIAGLELPDAGRIRLNDRVISSPGWALPPHQRQIGMLFQTPALWPHLTVRQNISFGLEDWERSTARQRVDVLLAQTGLGPLAGRYPHQISGGEARRVSLARALAPRPTCLLLDEPLTHLDPELKAEMVDLILDACREAKASLIYVTHDLEEGQKISDWLGTMSHGQLTIQPLKAGGRI